MLIVLSISLFLFFILGGLLLVAWEDRRSRQDE